MIFVTVGTHEQQFNRLIAYMDKLKKDKVVDEEIIIQTGFSTYEPEYCTWQKFYSCHQMLEFVDAARIVITHGGPSSFIMPLRIGKVPIVVPRQKKFDEHVNDHQVLFMHEMAKLQENPDNAKSRLWDAKIMTVDDIEELGHIITHYDDIVDSMQGGIRSNNERFNAEFSRIVQDLMAGRKKKAWVSRK